jgi:hypothetical protein
VEEVANTDIGLVFGVDAFVPTSFGQVVVDARYTMGTSNVWKDAPSTMKNRVFLLSIGVAF